MLDLQLFYYSLNLPPPFSHSVFLQLGAAMLGASYVFTTCLLVTLYFTSRSFAAASLSFRKSFKITLIKHTYNTLFTRKLMLFFSMFCY